jgi:ABC-type phosphate transport system substrate-binding protein
MATAPVTKTTALRLPAGAVIAWLLLSMAAAAADGYKVVVNSANPVTSLDRSKVSDLFLRRTSRWDDETPVLPVDGPNSPARESFSKDVHGKKAAAVRSYWLQVIFSGRGVPPPEKSSDTEVIAYVKAHPGAIGYVSAITPTHEVKVLEIQP